MYELHLPEAWMEDRRVGVRPIPIGGRAHGGPAPEELAAEPDARPECESVPNGARRPRARQQSDLDSAGIESAALATLDKLNRGVLLISQDGEIAFMNRAAQAMIGRRSGLSVREHRLEFLVRALQIRYEAFLEQMADRDGSTSLVLRVSGPRQPGTLRVLVSPLERPTDEYSPSHCIFIYEPYAGRRPVPLKVLSQLYGLSPAEAKLTNELFSGKSVQRAASSLGITTNTARSTLKRVFTKCAVSSQAALMQLLALGPRTL